MRALAIMSHQLMSADVPLDDPATADFLSAVFDAAALPQLLSVLAAGTTPAADAASGAIAERRLVAALLLLQNLSGGHGQVRPRLVQGGAIAALVGFLAARGNGGGSAPPGAERERTEAGVSAIQLN